MTDKVSYLPIAQDETGKAAAPKEFARVELTYTDGSKLWLEGADAVKWTDQVFAALNYAQRSGLEVERVEFKHD